jgi:hypothetical protein
MRKAGAWAAAGSIAALVPILALSWLSCSPYPAIPGYIAMPGERRVLVDAALQGGGGVELHDGGDGIGGGGGGLSIEPYLARSVSLPITLSAGGSPYGGEGIGRLGVRVRLLTWFVLGGGVSGGAYGTGGASSATGVCHLDTEIAVAHKWRHFGFSLVTRPGFEVVDGFFYLPVEAALAAWVMEEVAFTFHLYGGTFMDLEDGGEPGGWIAGGVGILLRLAR